MALTACADCISEVSTHGRARPHCGGPVLAPEIYARVMGTIFGLWVLVVVVPLRAML